MWWHQAGDTLVDLVIYKPCWRPSRWPSGASEWSPAGLSTSPAPPVCPGRAAGTAGLIVSPSDWRTLHPEATSYKTELQG